MYQDCMHAENHDGCLNVLRRLLSEFLYIWGWSCNGVCFALLFWVNPIEISWALPTTGPLHNQISLRSHGRWSVCLFSLKFRFVHTVYLWTAWQGHVICLSKCSFCLLKVTKCVNVHLYSLLVTYFGKNTNATAIHMQISLSVSCEPDL